MAGMHSRSSSVDSSYNIRKNPLNIRHLDGSDLVLDEKEPAMTQIIDLTGSHDHGYKLHLSPRTFAGLETFRYGLDRLELKGKQSVSLNRKDTITSNHQVHNGPSEVLAFRRLADARKKLDSNNVGHSHVQAALNAEHVESDSDSHIVEQITDLSISLPLSDKDVLEQGSIAEMVPPCPSLASYDKESIYEKESIYDDNAPSNAAPSSPPLANSPTIGDLDPVEPSDRGRLFLKILGLKDLKLPVQSDRRPTFTLTLDNGLQTVKTCPLDMISTRPHMIPIDYEFELVVGRDLQVVITLEAQQKPSRRLAADAAASVAEPVSPRKKRFNFFTPKAVAKKDDHQMVSPTDDLGQWRNVIGPRGEFARGYFVESQFEKEVYGKPQTFIFSCFNEWARSDDLIDERIHPYRMCGLQVTMLFIPRLYRSEDLPTSMKACADEIVRARDQRQVHHSGYLSQKGGDCMYWRRRWFTLDRSNLVGHHEDSRKIRNIINLTNAMEVTSQGLGGIYDDRTFQVKFQDGEILNFYADTVDYKDEWIRILSNSMTHCSGKIRRWHDLVIYRHEQNQKYQIQADKMCEQREKHLSGSFIEGTMQVV
jgi:hypothetical protein